MKFVTIQKLAELTGYSVAALKVKIQRGTFAQGIHFVKSPDGRIHFDTEAYEEWVKGTGSQHTA
ncbi:MAG: excisionase [Spirochaetales bacterium]|nr:excisionase [Spirochaetales bacterium]